MIGRWKDLFAAALYIKRNQNLTHRIWGPKLKIDWLKSKKMVLLFHHFTNGLKIEVVNSSVIQNQMIETLANGLWNLQSHRQYFQACKSWWIKAVNEETLTDFVRLSGLFCAIIRANLLTFRFILGKFGANKRVVWLSMVWLSGLCCIYTFFSNPTALGEALWMQSAQTHYKVSTIT